MTARHLAVVGFVYVVGTGVLEAVTRVGVTLVAALIGADIGLLTCVGAVVDLQVFQAGEALVAGGASVWLLIGMSPDVDEHLVPGIEATTMAGTALPMTAVSSILFRLDVMVIDVVNQVLEELKELVTLGPSAHQLLGQGQLW